MGLVVFLILNFNVILTSYLISSLIDCKRDVDRLLTAFVIWLAEIVGVTLLLGLVGFLQLEVIALTTGLFLILALFLSLKKGIRGPNYRPKLRQACQLKENKTLLALFLLAAIVILWLTFTGLIFPPSHWDAMMYHLYLPAKWLKAGQIFIPTAAPSSTLWFALYYPANAEVLFLWNILSLPPTLLVDLTQLPFLIFGAIACYSIAGKLGLEKKSSMLPAFIFLFTPIFVIQARAAYNGLILSSLFLIAINFLLSWNKTESFSSLLVMSISTGLLLGTKYTGLAYAFLLLVALLVLNRKKRKKVFATSLMVFIAISFIFGGYWYVRNLEKKGSLMANVPVTDSYPKLISNNWVPSSALPEAKKNTELIQEFILYPLLDGLPEKENYTLNSGFGPQLLSLIVPSILILIYITARKKDVTHSLLLFFLFSSLVFLYFIPPLSVRFALPLYGIACVTVAELHSWLNHKRLLEYIVVFCALFTLIGTAFSLVPYQSHYLSFGMDHQFFAPLRYNNKAMQQNVKAWGWLSNQSKAGSKIAYANLNVPFYLFGENLKNEPYYVKKQDYQDWTEAIKDKDYLYLNLAKISELVGEDRRNFSLSLPIEYAFAQDSDRFRQVYSSKFSKIYRIKKNETKGEQTKVINIGSGHEGKYLGAGWYENETEEGKCNYRWGGNGSCSTLHFRLNDTNYQLFFLAVPYLTGEKRKQTMTIKLNGDAVKKKELLNRWGTYNFSLPAEKMETGFNEIDFCYNYTIVPYNYTEERSDDKRKLGAMFDYVVLVPD